MQTFQTDYAVATGEYISEWSEEAQTPIPELAVAAGLPVTHLQQIVLGEAPLDQAAAEAVALVTDLTADGLLRLEAQYQTDLERLFTESCRQPGEHAGHRYRAGAALHWCPGAAAA
ncbi:hypothetical protein LG293_17380 (plasmid) [Citricoccus nitrophenolicus]